MRVIASERSLEPCAESGWFGYDLALSEPIDESLLEALGSLGRMNCIRTLKRPFFIVRAEEFVLRGIVGDRFLRAGFSALSAPQMEQICAVIDSVRPGK